MLSNIQTDRPISDLLDIIQCRLRLRRSSKVQFRTVKVYNYSHLPSLPHGSHFFALYSVGDIQFDLHYSPRSGPGEIERPCPFIGERPSLLAIPDHSPGTVLSFLCCIHRRHFSGDRGWPSYFLPPILVLDFMLLLDNLPQFTSSHSVFHSSHGLMNSINWPASSVWVFIAQLGEHCSANAEATGSNPVEAPKIFFRDIFAIA